MSKTKVLCVVVVAFAVWPASFVVGETITLKSDANTLAAVATNVETGDTTGLTFSPAYVGALGTVTPVPTGAPVGTEVLNVSSGGSQSGYFKTTFTLPVGFSDAVIAGVANVDDCGQVFLNGTPITPTPSPGNWGPIGQFSDGPFSANNQSLFIAGENVLLISDIDYYSGGPCSTAQD